MLVNREHKTFAASHKRHDKDKDKDKDGQKVAHIPVKKLPLL